MDSFHSVSYISVQLQLSIIHRFSFLYVSTNYCLLVTNLSIVLTRLLSVYAPQQFTTKPQFPTFVGLQVPLKGIPSCEGMWLYLHYRLRPVSNHAKPPITLNEILLPSPAIVTRFRRTRDWDVSQSSFSPLSVKHRMHRI